MPASAEDAAEAQPKYDPPRTTLGLPIATASPAFRAARPTTSSTGNSQIRAPISRKLSREATVSSSWLAIGKPAARGGGDAIEGGGDQRLAIRDAFCKRTEIGQ